MEQVPDDVLSRTIEALRDLVASGALSLADFEVAAGRIVTAATEAELADLVRQLAPPVRVTPPSRRLPELVELETSGMFADIKKRGSWQIPRRLRVRTGPSRITLDLTEAEFDAWEVDIDATVGVGDVTLIVRAGTAVQLVKVSGPVVSRLDPPVPGFPLVRLNATVGFGKIRLRHPKTKKPKTRRSSA